MIVVEDTKAEFEQCHVESLEKGATLFKTHGFRGFTLTQCSVIFANATKIQLDVPEIAMFLSNFSGNGSIELGKGKDLKGLDKAELAANIFSEGVQLQFGDITQSNVQLRNNIGTDFTALHGRPKQCDSAGTGYNVCMRIFMLMCMLAQLTGRMSGVI
jgi:hypothetical protein